MLYSPRTTDCVPLRFSERGERTAGPTWRVSTSTTSPEVFGYDAHSSGIDPRSGTLRGLYRSPRCSWSSHRNWGTFRNGGS